MQRVLAAAGPARSYSKRILKRMAGHPRTWAPKEVAPVPPPAYPVVPVETLPSGWAPPAVTSSTQGAMSVASTLPFQVSRTSKGQQIPVYTDFKNGRTRQLTVIRRITGNVDALREELRKVTGGAAVSVRPGRVEVEGDRSKELKTWLMGLGF